TLDRAKRRPDLVTDVGEEFAFRAVGSFGRFLRPLQLDLDALPTHVVETQGPHRPSDAQRETETEDAQYHDPPIDERLISGESQRSLEAGILEGPAQAQVLVAAQVAARS